MNSTKTEVSAGLAFMRATVAAAPRSLGDRERINVMSQAMGLAVKNRFPFDMPDAKVLKRMGIETCVGVFRPMELNYYREACFAGGTYARMWEDFHEQKAWRAAKAVRSDGWGHRWELEANGRVCPHTMVLMPANFTEPDEGLAEYEGLQVWWCTDFTNDTINLCRYRAGMESRDAFKKSGGAPARRRQLNREDWDIFQAAVKTLEGEEVRLKWTDENDVASFRKGWCIIANSYRKNIMRVDGVPRGFADDAAALVHVQDAALKGDALAVKALLIHEAGQKLPEQPASPAQLVDRGALELLDV